MDKQTRTQPEKAHGTAAAQRTRPGQGPGPGKAGGQQVTSDARGKEETRRKREGQQEDSTRTKGSRARAEHVASVLFMKREPQDRPDQVNCLEKKNSPA